MVKLVSNVRLDRLQSFCLWHGKSNGKRQATDLENQMALKDRYRNVDMAGDKRRSVLVYIVDTC